MSPADLMRYVLLINVQQKHEKGTKLKLFPFLLVELH